MQPITEEAFWYMVIGGAATIVLFVVWVKTGHRLMLMLAGIALSVTILLGVIEAVIVTPREEVEQTLDEIARHVQSNDVESVLSYLHSSAQRYRDEAKTEFPRHRFDRVKVTQITNIEIQSEAEPPTAVVEFIVSVQGDFFNDSMHNMRGLRAVTLHLQKEDEQWRITQYDHRPPQNALVR